ncbi:unnamed protein product, partial [Mesorhabditis belari]|uniref:Uncharacterized protein n=1 Tax=Mesorhabditis belari TaxID=2138241 RepID=A0AAF3FJC8_9BILA
MATYHTIALPTYPRRGIRGVFLKRKDTLGKVWRPVGRFVEATSHRSLYNTIAVTRGGKAWNGEELSSTSGGGRFLNVKLKKMGESSPNLTRIERSPYQLFPPLRPNETSYSSDAMHRILIDPRGKPKDCYSSSEYVAYLGRKHSQERIQHEPYPVWSGSQQAGPGAASRHGGEGKREGRLDIAQHKATRVHRSQSAGADATVRVHQPVDMRSPFTRADPNGNQPGNVKFLRATKKFFKKIYSTATLPKKSPQSPQVDQTMPSHTNVQPFFDFSYREPPRFSSSDDCDEPLYNSSFSTYCSNYRTPVETYRNELNLSTTLHYPKYADSQPDSGVDDRSSTPDESMDSAPSSSSPTSSTSPSTSTSSKRDSSGDQKPHVQIPPNGNWNEVFEQLRREMTLMRERDQQILADLHKVESQLKSVRLANCQFGSTEDLVGNRGPVPSMPL